MINYWEIFFVLGLGLIVGSFLNCVICRLKTGESFSKGRSYCPNCKHRLGLLDLIPVLSFMFLKGRCRYCKKPISPQYPLVELVTGVIFLLIFNFSAQGGFVSGEQFLNLLYYLIIASSLIVILFFDFKFYIIPDKIVLPAIGLAFIYRLLGIWDQSTKSFLCSAENSSGLECSGLVFSILPSLLFLSIILFSHGRWMGFGDFKLAVLMGLVLGFPNIFVAMFLAFFSGAIMGIGLVLFGRKKLKSEVPFGPFLVAGTFAALLWGQNIINWYFNLLII